MYFDNEESLKDYKQWRDVSFVHSKTSEFNAEYNYKGITKHITESNKDTL